MVRHGSYVVIQSAVLRTHLAGQEASTVTRQRSPFGELLRFHRRRLGLTQAQLAAQVQWRVARDARSGDVSSRETFSPRTISNHERMWDDPRAFKRPQISTVRLLAEVFGLPPGSPEFAEFFQAAEFEAGQSTEPAPSVRSASVGETIAQETDGAERNFVPEGREPHLQQLREAVARAVSGVPQVTLVHAEPGTGKSWLIEEMCREAVERYHDLVVFWGECVGRFEMADPYHPIRQVLDIAMGGIPLASPQQLISMRNRDRLTARVPLAIGALLDQGPGLIDRLVSAQTLIERAAEFGTAPTVRKALPTMTQLPFAARPDSSGPIEAFSHVVMAIAAGGPVILVIEDVHWADEGTCEMLAHLVQSIQQHRVPLLLICSYRPADLVSNDILHSHPFHTLRQQVVELHPEAEIDLGTAIGGAAGQAFIDGYIARRQTRLPASFRASLFAQTGGMPLFVDSMLRLFRQEGVIAEGEDGALELAGEPVLRELPREIDAVFTEQVERIPPDMQRVLAWASVQEGAIVAEALLRALRIPPSALTTLLDAQLVERHDLLRPHGTTVVAGQPVHRYRFRHALLQDFLDRRIGEFERTRYHKATADAFRELYGADPHEGSAVMAWHYERAGEKTLAAEAEIAAGNFAMSHGNYDRARHHFQQVRELRIEREAPHLAAQALMGRANCDRAQGTAASARDHAQQAVSLARYGSSEETLANSLMTLAMIEFDTGLVLDQAGDLPEARHFYETSLEIGRQLGRDALMLDSLAGLLRVAMGTDAQDEARSLLAEIESRVTAHGVEGAEQVGWLYLTLVRATLALGARDRATRYLDAAVRYIRERADRMTDATMRASYLTNIRSHRELLELSSTFDREAT